MECFLSVLIIAAIIYFAIRISALQSDLNKLRDEVNLYRRGFQALKPGQTSPPPPPPAPKPAVPEPPTEETWWTPLTPEVQTPPTPPISYTPRVPEPQPEKPKSQESLASFRYEWESPTPAPKMSEPPRAAQAKRPPSRTSEEWEMLIGGNIFNRIGAILLIIAAALFITLELKNDVFTPPPALRAIIGLVTGVILLWGGANSHAKKLVIFGQGLTGAGISILYLTVYGAYAFLGLTDSVLLALVGMTAVTFVAFWQAVKYDSIAISLLGWAGGLLTPFLVRPPAPTAWGESGFGVCLYLFFFQLSLLATLTRKMAWAKVMEPLTLLGIYIVYFFWYATHRETATLIPLPFLAAFWGLFLAFDLYHERANPAKLPEKRLLMSGLNAGAVGLAVYLLLARLHPAWAGVGLFGIALGYAVPALVLAARRTAPSAQMRYLLAAIIFLALATAKQCHGFTRIDVWALEALAILYAGLYSKRRYVWSAALTLFGVALFGLLMTPGALVTFTPLDAYTPLLNLRALAFLVLGGALAASAVLVTRLGDDRGDRDIATALHYGWSILGAMLITVEINDFFRQRQEQGVEELFRSARYMVMAVCWTLYSLPLVWFGLRRNKPPFYVVGFLTLALGVGMLAIFGAHYAPMSGYLPVVNMRAIPFVLVIIGLLLQARWLWRRREEHPWTPTLVSVVQTLAALLLFEVLTVETLDGFRLYRSQTGNREFARYAQQMALPVVWTLYALGVSWYALQRRNRPLQVCALSAQALAVVTIAGVAMAFRPLDQHILFNIRATATLLVIAGVLMQWRLLRRYGIEALTRVPVRAIAVCVVALLGFELLTVETNSAFIRWAQTSAHPLAASVTVRAMALAAVWSLYALPVVWLAVTQRLRGLWWIGLVTLTLSVITAATFGMRFSPIAEFTTILNARALPFALIIILLGVQTVLLRKRGQEMTETPALLGIFRVTIALLLYELCTVEVLDYYARLRTSGTPDMHLGDERQMVLCLVWVAYSGLLLGYGIWKKHATLRVLAIAVFVLTLLITCGYYLLGENAFYRMVAIVALALSLLGTSYLYQRYKSVILSRPPAEEKDPSLP